MNNAVIWGAAGGLGQALVAALRAEDWQVHAVTRSPSAAVVALTPHCYEADVADAQSVQRTVQAIAMETSDVALAIYAVGDIASLKLEALTPADFARILNANLTGAYLTAHYSLPLLTAEAHFMFVGAVIERLKLPGLSAYVAAKAGLEAFTDTLRKEERKRRVTLVRPGAVNTPFWAKVPFRMPAGALAPAELAQRMLEAHKSGHSGLLDI